ncbi:MAG: chromate transporter [Tannerellaceae bacterium]|jgi:chromate transporter|nr:chromate transporter [Tannerellaceae bacterium]
MIYLKLFLVYLKIGLFNFGGGYAMLSLIQDEVVERRSWITMQEFTDIVAVSQMTPGPIGINSATYVGYMATLNEGYPPGMAALGSCVATLAVCLPAFVLIVIISYYFTRFKENRYVAAAFLGLRPATVGLIAAAALLLVNSDNFIDPVSPLIFIAAFLLTWKLRLNPILTILLAGLAGLLLY